MKTKIFTRIFWFALGSVIALFVLSCDVNADDNFIPPLAFRIFQNSNWQNVTTTSNAWVAPGQVVLEVGSTNSLIGKSTLPEYIWVRMCQQNDNVRATDIATIDFAIGSAESARLIYTTTPCTPYGTELTGVQVVAEWGISNGEGSECFVDADIMDWACNINTAMAFNISEYAGFGEVFYGYSNQPLSIPDAEKIVEQGLGTLVEQNQIIIDTQKETNQKLEDINNTLTENDLPDMNGFADEYAGYLPAGPLDVAINMPKTIILNLKNSLSQTCEPISLSIPFLPTSEKIRIPCLNTLYSRITGLNVLINFISYCAMGLIFFRYAHFLSEVKDSILTLSFEDLTTLENPYKRGKI